MVKLFSTFIFVFIVFDSLAQQLNLHEVRKDFNKGVQDEALCKKYLSHLQNHAKSPIEKGYEAAFHMFMAKHTSNPFKKMNYFKGGKKMLETQIKAEPSNTELRFIRLCIQYYIPDFLGYKQNIEEDKNFLVNNLHKMSDERTKDIIFKYLKGAKMYNDQELTLLAR